MLIYKAKPQILCLEGSLMVLLCNEFFEKAVFRGVRHASQTIPSSLSTISAIVRLQWLG